jgi:hypothetical protein
MTVARSYPVTPLAAFAVDSGFDSWDAINAPNVGGACPAMPTHAGQTHPAQVRLSSTTIRSGCRTQ